MDTVRCTDCGKRKRWPKHLRERGRKCCGPCWSLRGRDWNNSNPERRLLNGARNRAKVRGLEFTITEQDITIPDRCPILDIPLSILSGSRKRHDDSISLDRIDNTRGYIPGNVAVISYAANRIKSNLSLEAVDRLATYCKRR